MVEWLERGQLYHVQATLLMVQTQVEQTTQLEKRPSSQPSRSLTQAINPQYLTPFVGRQAEVAKALRLLRSPDCRLLTLVGAGGIGKTRLAIRLAEELHAAGRQVTYVDLQPVQAAGFLVPAIIDALNLPSNGQDDPKTRLLRHLGNREVVLVLDNFEHLLAGAVLVADLLRAAPGVKLLITSRVVLHLHEEWLFPVDGLCFPAGGDWPAEDREASETYDAVRFFVSCVQRVRPDFQLEAEAEGVVRVCQFVEGMPLAIELAAAWAKTLTPDAIAEEVARDLDFLATPLRNVLDKHRSMVVVFQRSWDLLDEDEREVFKRLAVFRGGFDRDAAVAVAGASLPTLATLVDKSLLRWRPNGRYEIHELLRQYAEDQLAQSPDELARTRNQHSSYYADFLGKQVNELTTQQRAALTQTRAELDNIRIAWQWATSQARLGDIQRAAMSFFAFCQGQSRYREGVDALTTAYASLANLPPSLERDRTLAELLTGRGWLELRLGRLAEAANGLETARELYATWALLPATVMGADPLPALAVLAVIRGDYTDASDFAAQAWQAATTRNDRANLALAGYALTATAIAQGSYEEALDHARETLALAKTVGNRWFTAYVYNHLGEIMQMLGEPTAAREYYQESYVIREEFDDPEGMGVALNHLGEIALLEREYSHAQKLYEQSLAIYQGLGDQGGLVQAYLGLGMAAHGQGDEPTARQHLQYALHVAVETQLTPLLLSLLVGVGTVLLKSGSPEWGMAALAFVQQHPASNQLTKDSVQKLLAPEDVQQQGQAPALESLLHALMAELALPRAPNPAAPAPTLRQPSKADQSLIAQRAFAIEPLSEREMEVLAFIAAGLKNREIAMKLSVTLSTVKAHSNNIYRKLDVNSRIQAVTRAQELQLL